MLLKKKINQKLLRKNVVSETCIGRINFSLIKVKKKLIVMQ